MPLGLLAGLLIADVDRQKRELRLADALAQRVLAPVELVVAHRGRVDADGVERLDRRGALEEARDRRALHEVPRVHYQRPPGVLGLLALQVGGQRGRPAGHATVAAHPRATRRQRPRTSARSKYM